MTEAGDAAAGRRLLILDDDEMVGILIETVARLHGLPVRRVDRHPDFLALLDTWQPTDLLIDLNMPGLAGEDVLRELGERGCRARIIIASGAEPERLAAAAALVRRTSLVLGGTLAKPFRPAALRELLAVPDVRSQQGPQ